MSHELRTPSAQILLLLELVLADTETPLSDNHRSLLEQAIRSGDALLELIGAVLVGTESCSLFSYSPQRLTDSILWHAHRTSAKSKQESSSSKRNRSSCRK